LWRNRAQSRFSINGKKENEIWRIFYLKKIYEETLIIGKLERTEWNKSPFYPNGYKIPVQNTTFFHDQFDNWLLYESNCMSENYVYISSKRLNSERIRIYHDSYKFFNVNSRKLEIYGLYTWIDKPYSKVNITEIIETFLQKKEKLFWFTSHEDENTIKDFEDTVISKITPELRNQIFKERQERQEQYQRLKTESELNREIGSEEFE
jgi:hypothetical protein